VAASNSAPLLEIHDLHKSYGGVQALTGISMGVAAGEIVGIIGPNGAGKTTLFDVLSGVTPPTQGRAVFQGEDLLVGSFAGTSLRRARPQYRVSRQGLSRTFQNIRLFPEMSVLENVMVGVDSRGHSGFLSVLLGLRTQRAAESAQRRRAVELLDFVGLGPRKDSMAGNLSYGEQRRLEIARALGSSPSLLLLDEPAAGMNIGETRHLTGLVRKVRDSGVTVLIIEHDMRVVMGLCDRIVVLNFGNKIAEGTPDEIRRDDRVLEAYLGTDEPRETSDSQLSPVSHGSTVLEIDDLHAHYGGIEAVKGVALSLRRGEIVALIGANGAGKTTILRTISGLKHPTTGSISFCGRRIDGARADRIVGMGVIHVPEGRFIFGRMTVWENLEIAAYGSGGSRDGVVSDARSRIEDALDFFPVLRDKAGSYGAALSGGQQQMLAIARALVAQPDVLMLDEPSMGLAPILVRELFDLIESVRSRGTSILLVEQNARAALGIADRGYVLESGRVVAAGSSAELVASDVVRRAYLGD
jgi:branched-chain amino acid transport system ATP-binding protein